MIEARHVIRVCSGSRWLIAVAACILLFGDACRESGSGAGVRDGGKQDAFANMSTSDVTTSDLNGNDAGTSGNVGGSEVGSVIGGDTAEGREASAEVDARFQVDVGSGASADALDSSSWSPACSAYAKAACTLIACIPSGLHVLFGSEQNCENRYGGAACEAQMTSVGSHVTQSSLAACAQALATESCAEARTEFPAECSWQGDRANNSPCTYAQQCESGVCVPATGTFCGTCQAKLPVGASCPSTAHACQNGLVCTDSVSSGGDWFCTEPGSEGDACVSPAQCAWGLTCFGARCVRVRSQGDACTNTVECDQGQDLTCSPNVSGIASSCIPRTYADAGESCGTTAAMECLDNASCVDKTGSPAVTGVCSASAANGESCEIGTTNCQYPALCIGGKCKTAADMASSCD